MKEQNELIVSSPVACSFFRVTPMTLSNWTKMGMPKVSRGRYDLKACFAWWQENMNKPASKKEEDSRERYWSAKADREEMARDEQRGDLIPRSIIANAWAERAALYRQGIEALEHRLPPRLEGKDLHEMRGILAQGGREILLDVLRSGTYTEEQQEEQQ